MGGRGRAAAAEGPKADVVPLTEEEEVCGGEMLMVMPLMVMPLILVV